MSSILDKLSDTLGETATGAFEVKHFLDTGYAPLNRIISGRYDGGMPVGRIVEMFGMQSCGKTAIATKVMACAINAGGFAMFNDHERSFDIGLARDLGLDADSGRFAHLKPETLEESFMRAIKTAAKIREKGMIPADAPIVAVFDSLAAMVPKSKSLKELDELTMADSLALAKATSTVLPAVNQYAEKFDMLVLILNQLRENPGQMYGDSSRTPGGKAPGFYSSVRIKLNASALKDKTTKERLGQVITAECIKNKVTRPFQKVNWDFLYMDDGSGRFDALGGMLDHLITAGTIEQSGAWITFEGKKYQRSVLVKKLEEDNREADLHAMCLALDKPLAA